MIEKICNTLITIILIVVVAVAGCLVVPRVLGFTPYTVLSGSMEPAFHVGSLIFVKDTPAEDINTGDAITFKINGQNGTVATHRVVDIDPEARTFTTKGDANEVIDMEPVSFAALVGKAFFTIPYLGYLSIYIKTKEGLLMGCGLLLIIILLGVLPRVFGKEEKDIKRQK